MAPITRHGHHHEEEHECCHGHHHDHGHDHAHHHADEVFTSWGVETSKKFDKAELEKLLSSLSDAARFGEVLRAKGIVAGSGAEWIHFDYIPGEVNVRTGAAAVTGRLCVIGAKIDGGALALVFFFVMVSVATLVFFFMVVTVAALVFFFVVVTVAALVFFFTVVTVTALVFFF